MTTKEQVVSQIGEHRRIQRLIAEAKKPKENGSFMEMFKAFLAEALEDKVQELGLRELKDGYTPIKGKDYFTNEELKTIEDFIISLAPEKGVHYFDGEKGAKGDKGDRGGKGEKGDKGDKPSPKEVKMMLGAIIKDLSPEELGMFKKEEVVNLISEQKSSSRKTLDKKIKELTELVMLNYGGHGGSRISAYDLSSSLNGVTKTFTIPNHSKIVQVTSSSTPFVFRPTVDFTDTATTIVFDVGVDAPSMLSNGQSIIILYLP
jgi:hypothetical protein